MKTKNFISAIIILTMASCNNSRNQENHNQGTPKALTDKNPVSEIVSSRGYNDLIESLYDELVSNNSELKQLEDKIDDLNKSKSDTTEVFNKFNNKNKSYYSVADRHIQGITDSLLREKTKALISNSLVKYNSSIAKHNELLKAINKNELTLTDLHTVLKITLTLPLIEKYQAGSLPSTKSLEGFIDRQNEAINLMDSLSK